MQGGPSAMHATHRGMHTSHPSHRGAWCPKLPLPLPTVEEMDTISTNAGLLSEVPEEDAESSEDSPEWTPRGMGGHAGAPPFLDSESQPPWVTVTDCTEARLSAGSSKPVPRMPQMFDVYTPRSPQGATKPKASPNYLDIPTEYMPKRADALPYGIPCGVPCSPRLHGDCGVPCSPGLDTARREVAEAHVELLARAAELRRREKRLQRKMEHQGGGADKENAGSTNDLDTSFDITPAKSRSDQDYSFDSIRKSSSSTIRNAPAARITPQQRDSRTQNRQEGPLDSGRKGVGLSESSQRFYAAAPSSIHRPGDLVHGSGPLPAPSRRAKTVSPRQLYASRAAPCMAVAFSPREVCTPREFRTHRESREVRREDREVRYDSPREGREVRSRKSAPAVAFSDSDTRRMKKEIRLERRLRRRAEEAATAVWRNALLIAGAVSLCVVGVTALSVAFAIRH